MKSRKRNLKQFTYLIILLKVTQDLSADIENIWCPDLYLALLFLRYLNVSGLAVGYT